MWGIPAITLPLNWGHETDSPHTSQALCWSRGSKFSFQFKWCVLWFMFPIPYFHSCATVFLFQTHSRLSCWVFWSMSICDVLMGVTFTQPSCSYFLQQIWLLLLQYLKLPFHCQEEIGFSISGYSFSPTFPCFTGSSAGTWCGGSQRVTLAHGQLHPLPHHGANLTLQPPGVGMCTLERRRVILTEWEQTLSSCSVLRALSVWEWYLIH